MRTNLTTILFAFIFSFLMFINPLSDFASTTAAQNFLCDGDPLEAIAHRGAVDAVDIPNSNAGTLPGDFIVLRWHKMSLQIPRTNNAGVPSYSDGRWWWQALDPNHPTFAQLRRKVENYSCETVPSLANNSP